MGYYIETEAPTYKVQQLMSKYGCTLLSLREQHTWKSGVAREVCIKLMDSFDIVVVVSNGHFEAAGYAYDVGELDRFMNDEDRRPHWLLLFPKGEAAKLSGYPLEKSA